MQDIYAFDVGDFGKLGLLRLLAAKQLSLGVLWWKTQLGTPGADGKHVSYLQNPRFRVCDPPLWDEMGRRFRSGGRTISALKPLLPGDTVFHNEVVPHASARTQWLRNAMERVKSADVVFCDPDNGIVFDDDCCRSPRHIGVAEIRQLFGAGHSLVIYHHLNRSTSHERQVEQGLKHFSSDVPGLSASWGARFRRGSSRVFFVLAQARHANAFRQIVEEIQLSRWTLDGHFHIVSAAAPLGSNDSTPANSLDAMRDRGISSAGRAMLAFLVEGRPQNRRSRNKPLP